MRTTPCTLIYHIHGIANPELTSTLADVCEEVQEVLSCAGPVSAKPISNGLEVLVSVTDIEPFKKEEFEPYVYEHVIWHAINACCEMEGDDGFRFELITVEFN